MLELKSDTEALTGRSDGHQRMKAILVLAAAVGFALSPFLTAGFGGFAPDLFPIPQERPPVQPAGYAFGIWALIYLALVAHAGYGLVARADDPAWDAPRWPLIASLVVGASWIAVANTSAPMATVLIWVMLAGALGALALMRPRDPAARWLGQAPLGVYAGWLTAASWVAVGLMLGGYGVLPEAWAAAVAVAAAVGMAALVQMWLWRAPEYGATVVWALVAVVVANAAAGRWALALLALLGIAAMAATLVRLLRR